MLIDDFLPKFDLRETEQSEISAQPDKVFAAIKNFDMSESTTIRWMFKLRGHSLKKTTLADFEKANFKILAQKPDAEITLGMIGKFDSASGGLVDLPPEKFKDFADAGFIKAVWEFSISQSKAGKSLLNSEMRIATTDAASKARIENYWGIVKTPTAMVRKEILKLIKKQAER